MIRLLLIADDSCTEPLIPALASAADFQLVRRSRLDDAKGALSSGAFDACLLLPARADVCAQRVRTVRATAPNLVLAVALPAAAAASDQAAVLTAGADLALVAPVDATALAATLRRLTRTNNVSPTAVATGPGCAAAAPDPGPVRTVTSSASALDVLRGFSPVLGHSLDHRALTQHFAVKLREAIGVTRVAIFLAPDGAPALSGPSPAAAIRLPCAAAAGLPADLAGCFDLNRAAGLGRHLTALPQILRAAACTDPETLREFAVLGGQVAMPVHDRERPLGVAVLGGRLTGGEFTDEELLLVYHLLEELGLAVKNGWLHQQLARSHGLFAAVLDTITVGALVVGPDLTVRYANHALGRFVGGADTGEVAPADLPAPVAQQLRDAAERGAATAPFFHETAGPTPQVWRVTVLPLRDGPESGPGTALLLLEDFTSVRTAQRAEIESSNLRLINLIARRFAHEIRNSLVPLTTHEQLFDAEIGNADFRTSLKHALGRETHRIQRFTEQMLLLAHSDAPPAEVASLADLIHLSFKRARAFAAGPGELELVSELATPTLRCHRPSLEHAFEEIFLNALQSAGTPARLSVSVAAPADSERNELVIRLRDSGPGFAPDVALRATEPFFTTRNTGVGLGLTVARRVIEAHRGRLEIRTRGKPTDPDLVIRLPQSV